MKNTLKSIEELKAAPADIQDAMIQFTKGKYKTASMQLKIMSDIESLPLRERIIELVMHVEAWCQLEIAFRTAGYTLEEAYKLAAYYQ